MKTTGKILNIGFIGCGAIAREYLSRLICRPEAARVTAFCDLDLERARQLSGDSPSRCYTNYREMFAKEELDAVFDNLPPFARSHELIEAAGRGFHIFSTKPLGLDLDTARRSLAAIEAAGVINSVGYMFRYSGLTQEARRLLTGRPILLVNGTAVSPPPGGWFSHKETSGGQLVEMSTHIFDLMRYFAGDIQVVRGLGRRFLPNEQVNFHDVSTVALEFQDGAIGSMNSSCVAEQFYWDCTLVAPGAQLHLIFDKGTMNGHVDGQLIEYQARESGYQEQIDAFLQAVLTGNQAEIRSSYRDGLATFATTLAAAQSLETSRAEAVASY